MKRTVLIFVSYVVLVFSTQATVYYVDPNNGGGDNNSGLLEAPWATIQQAASTAQAGDTVYVQAGTYAEKVTFTHSGTVDNYITFIGQGTVVVEGTAATTVWSGIFNINTRSYIRIQNFTLQNSYWFGFYVEASNHIYLENNKTYNTGSSGISVWHSSYIYAGHNTVRKACYQSLSTGSQECITFSGVSNFEIHDNEVFESGGSNNGGEGIDTKENCSYGKVYNNHVHDLIRLGIYADSWDKTLQYVDIYNNRVYKCGDGIVVSSENGGTATNINIYNNLTYNNRNFGIVISNFSDNNNDGFKRNVNIMNNTIYNNGFRDASNLIDNNTGWGGGIIIYSEKVSDISIFNNIVSANDAMQISDGSGVASVSINKNLIYGYRGHNWTDEVKGTNVVEGNPLFVDADGADDISGNADDDLTISLLSPAINQGVNADAPEFDYAYYKRPAGGTVDIGAYETNSIPLSIKNSYTTNSTKQLAVIYPNPSNGEFNLKLTKKVDRIEIVDSRGELVKSYTMISEALVKMSIADAGMYMVRVYAEGVCQTYKVIKY